MVIEAPHKFPQPRLVAAVMHSPHDAARLGRSITSSWDCKCVFAILNRPHLIYFDNSGRHRDFSALSNSAQLDEMLPSSNVSVAHIDSPSFWIADTVAEADGSEWLAALFGAGRSTGHIQLSKINIRTPGGTFTVEEAGRTQIAVLQIS